jgi:hypothetical protein
MMPTQMILVRVLLAKVEDTKALAQKLRRIPVRQGEEGWNCVVWVQEALASLATPKGVLGTNVLQWQRVRDIAMTYCQQKKDQHRFDGRGKFDMSKVPTWDLTHDKETIA